MTAPSPAVAATRAICEQTYQTFGEALLAAVRCAEHRPAKRWYVWESTRMFSSWVIGDYGVTPVAGNHSSGKCRAVVSHPDFCDHCGYPCECDSDYPREEMP